MDTDYHKIYNEDHLCINEDIPIVFGDKVWIGCRSTVLKGTHVPLGVIIAFGSVVTGNLERNNCIYTDKIVLKERVFWES